MLVLTGMQLTIEAVQLEVDFEDFEVEPSLIYNPFLNAYFWIVKHNYSTKMLGKE